MRQMNEECRSTRGKESDAGNSRGTLAGMKDITPGQALFEVFVVRLGSSVDNLKFESESSGTLDCYWCM